MSRSSGSPAIAATIGPVVAAIYAGAEEPVLPLSISVLDPVPRHLAPSSAAVAAP